jgi:hypothetical protein
VELSSAEVVLEHFGLLPGSVGTAPAANPGDDLLERLEHHWSGAAGRETGASGRRCQRIEARLRAWRQRGARLTWGVPGIAQKPVAPWLGARLAWWPGGIPEGRWVGLISSRLGRDLELRQRWFTALRVACMNLEHPRDVLVTARSISTQRFVRRAGELFGLRVLELDIDDQPDRTPAQWGRRILEADPEVADSCLGLHLSLPQEPFHPEPPFTETPVADRAVVALSDRLIVLHARGKGNVQRLVSSRLGADGFPAASVFLALGPDLVPAELAQPWMDCGAVGWYLQSSEEEARAAERVPWQRADSFRPHSAPVRRLAALPERDLLTHWTRRRAGPWPDQPSSDYLDDLILDRRGADHSAFAALWRIVRTRRLVATGDLLRGAEPMVCFTRVPLAEWSERRSFRPHLSRWDFEPFGISIERSWLSGRGAQAVQYGDEDLWESLPEQQRPFFQKRITQSRHGQQIDWSLEREWRHRGDVLLDELPPESALVFVPTLGHARPIANISPWPVIVLD